MGKAAAIDPAGRKKSPGPRIYYLSLGSNLGRRRANLARARALLEAAGLRIVKASSVHDTPPEDVEDQPRFLNQVIAVSARRTPGEVLHIALGVENRMGRRRIVRRGPRTIDIDVLLAGDRVARSARLTIPHPRMHRRLFVLAPLVEIAPRVRHPVLGATAERLLRAVRTRAGTFASPRRRDSGSADPGRGRAGRRPVP